MIVINLQYNMETAILLSGTVLSMIATIWILSYNWRRYGLLFVLSSVAGNILCYILVVLGFYSFPYRLFPELLKFPAEIILTVFPVYVLLGVRYSPAKWAYKVPFYWALVNLGLLGETMVKSHTAIIRYDFEWDFWDSYTLWWIFFLFFEWVGGKIIPVSDRRPISQEAFAYGNWAWILFHAIMIGTIFGVGWYLGNMRP